MDTPYLRIYLDLRRRPEMSRRVRGEGLARVFAGHLSLRFSGCCPRCFFVPSDRRLLVAGTWNCDLSSTPLLSSDPFLTHFFVAVALFWGARWFFFFFSAVAVASAGKGGFTSSFSDQRPLSLSRPIAPPASPVPRPVAAGTGAIPAPFPAVGEKHSVFHHPV